ncbi:RICIN domain-containing protein [Frankia sp. AvcI1]|uniref:RICIN domain-containing protein n=1 Tax=Frankia sp. AvcI1 TaxID=573496 RepID=UPI0021183E3C|nr:RICIN domain-containing protein [Frankia sp. AvcI1]
MERVFDGFHFFPGRKQRRAIDDYPRGLLTMMSNLRMRCWPMLAALIIMALQVPCGTGADRLWKKTRDGGAWRFINDRSGKLMSVPGSSTTRGLQLHQWADGGHGDQRWTILPRV